MSTDVTRSPKSVISPSYGTWPSTLTSSSRKQKEKTCLLSIVRTKHLSENGEAVKIQGLERRKRTETRIVSRETLTAMQFSSERTSYWDGTINKMTPRHLKSCWVIIKTQHCILENKKHEYDYDGDHNDELILKWTNSKSPMTEWRNSITQYIHCVFLFC